MPQQRFTIEPRSASLGGGWHLRLFDHSLEDGKEVEMGGGVFPPEDGITEDDAYADALQTGEDWLSSRTDNEV